MMRKKMIRGTEGSRIIFSAVKRDVLCAHPFLRHNRILFQGNTL